MTQVESYNAIENILNATSEEICNAELREELIEFCKSRKEQIEKKNANKSSKKSEENQVYASAILECLEDSQGMTTTEIYKLCMAEFENISPQKISYILNKVLIPESKVVRKEVKGKAYFSIAE